MNTCMVSGPPLPTPQTLQHPHPEPLWLSLGFHPGVVLLDHRGHTINFTRDIHLALQTGMAGCIPPAVSHPHGHFHTLWKFCQAEGWMWNVILWSFYPAPLWFLGKLHISSSCRSHSCFPIYEVPISIFYPLNKSIVIILLGFDNPLNIPDVNFLLFFLRSRLSQSVTYLFSLMM